LLINPLQDRTQIAIKPGVDFAAAGAGTGLFGADRTKYCGSVVLRERNPSVIDLSYGHRICSHGQPGALLCRD
jgi:hypothetical protein